MTPDGGIERFADFAVSREVPHPQTWQVPRAPFDALLLDHAGACGADVHQQHRVLDAAFDSLGVTVTVRDISRADDNAATAPCRSLRARRRGRLGAGSAPRPRLSTSVWTSRDWRTWRSSPITPACRAPTAAAPATFASSPAAIAAGSG